MTLHIVEPERRTLHGAFSRELPPILEIESVIRCGFARSMPTGS
jgi:hypothetical protein